MASSHVGDGSGAAARIARPAAIEHCPAMMAARAPILATSHATEMLTKRVDPVVLDALEEAAAEEEGM